MSDDSVDDGTSDTVSRPVGFIGVHWEEAGMVTLLDNTEGQGWPKWLRECNSACRITYKNR